jgi:UDP-N-acetylglucosamine:LPS N-acetylglucosamine transferase
MDIDPAAAAPSFAGASQGNIAPSVLVILSGGGFSFETKILLSRMSGKLQCTYLLTNYGGEPGRDGIPPGVAHLVPEFATVTRNSQRQNLRAFLATFAVTYSVVKAAKIRTILGVGCSHVVPMFLAGRLTGCRNIFVETITRSDRPSITGKIVYYLRLADLFIVQWPELKRQLPRAQIGTIL